MIQYGLQIEWYRKARRLGIHRLNSIGQRKPSKCRIGSGIPNKERFERPANHFNLRLECCTLNFLRGRSGLSAISRSTLLLNPGERYLPSFVLKIVSLNLGIWHSATSREARKRGCCVSCRPHHSVIMIGCDASQEDKPIFYIIRRATSIGNVGFKTRGRNPKILMGASLETLRKNYGRNHMIVSIFIYLLSSSNRHWRRNRHTTHHTSLAASILSLWTILPTSIRTNAISNATNQICIIVTRKELVHHLT